MMFASACLVCLFASSLAVPVQRSSTGDQLLAAVGAGTAAGLSQATGDLLAHGLTTAIETSLTKLTPLITKGITSALSLIGKREEDRKRNALDDLRALIGAGNGLDFNNIIGQVLGKRDQADDKITITITKGNVVQKRDCYAKSTYDFWCPV